MKRVGILTMHRVCNYGSALQAWATQEILQKMGYQVKLIDYVFPNEYHKQFQSKIPLRIKIARMVMNILYHHPMRKKQEEFRLFREKYLHCTKCFETKESLVNVSGAFDIYLIGSDQVWNPDSFHEDYSFFFDFISKNHTKISYASSFSKSKLINCDIRKIAELLNTFKSISVREKNAQIVVKELIGRDVPLCLDPTLLLDKESYNHMAEDSKVKIKEDYILVYVLKYAFNPYPYTTCFIENLSLKTGLKIVCIDFSAKEYLKLSNCLHLHDAIGPSEFLWLLRHAKLIITNSFHGTAFAINFCVPFFSIVNNEDTGDDRIVSLIQQVGADSRLVKKDSTIPHCSCDIDWGKIQSNLINLREKSLDYLKKSIL